MARLPNEKEKCLEVLQNDLPMNGTHRTIALQRHGLVLMGRVCMNEQSRVALMMRVPATTSRSEWTMTKEAADKYSTHLIASQLELRQTKTIDGITFSFALIPTDNSFVGRFARFLHKRAS